MRVNRSVVGWFVSSLTATVLVSLAGAPTGAVEAPSGDAEDRDRSGLRMLQLRGAQKTGAGQSAPRGPNPYLALLPNPAKADYAGWQAYLQARAGRRANLLADRLGRAGAVPPIGVDDRERPGTRGRNDQRTAAQRVPGFGTDPAENFRTHIQGTLSPEAVRTHRVRRNQENDGSMQRARNTGITRLRNGIRTNGRIGDGPHGRARGGTGDFDYYRMRVPAGHRITARVVTPRGRLDPMVAVLDSRGRVVAFNDDFRSLDSFLTHTVRTGGTYTVIVTGFFSVPMNPFRSGSGTGADSEGRYRLRVKVGEDDRDMFAVPLRPGDVLGATTRGGASELTIYDPSGVEVKGSTFDASMVYPAKSPLPGGGNAVTEHVADETGLHYVSVRNGAGAYDITVEAYRPALEGDAVAQTLFLDFNGARINTGIWGGPGVRQLSPLRAFLPRWGIQPGALNRLIDAIVAEVQENVQADLVASGLADNFEIEVLNSRDHADTFGEENVSRIIVGGTIRQSGIPTIGIAQSIDPGNFDTEESSLVLLDVLSSRRGPGFSLNTWLRPQSNRVGFVGQAVGNVASHEAGHFFGDWHVDQFNGKANLMDQGGAFRLMFGVGRDGIGGTSDDPDVDFGEDRFNPFEGFTGVEDTLSRLAAVIVR
ncbi:MAG: hypothetical protein M3165_05290 [Actinomycetota bacterium]|nr:hypothetical protein [Actinomycetota bacterium]